MRSPKQDRERTTSGFPAASLVLNVFAQGNDPRTVFSVGGQVATSDSLEVDVNDSLIGKHLQLHQFEPFTARVEIERFLC